MAEPNHPSEPIAGVIITGRIAARPSADPDHLREKQAMQDLAQQMADRPTEIIRASRGACDGICDGVSSRVSVLDPETKCERRRALLCSGTTNSSETGERQPCIQPRRVPVEQTGPVRPICQTKASRLFHGVQSRLASPPARPERQASESGWSQDQRTLTPAENARRKISIASATRRGIISVGRSPSVDARSASPALAQMIGSADGRRSNRP